MNQDKAYDKMVEKIAKNVVRIRHLKGLTQEDMIDLGFSYRHYQRVESGVHSPNLLTLFRLAQAFKVDIREFFSERSWIQSFISLQ
jgi:transcriptional regulator with XRE-family HTH domain